MKVVGYNFICYLSYMIIGMIMFMLNVISFQIPLTTEDQYSEGKRNILENEELKSDIFHIKLNMSGTFKLTLPIHDKPRPHGFNREIQYAELIVKISHKTLGHDKVTATKAVYSHGKVSLGFATSIQQNIKCKPNKIEICKEVSKSTGFLSFQFYVTGLIN